MTFQYARRRKHALIGGNPFKKDYILKGDTYRPAGNPRLYYPQTCEYLYEIIGESTNRLGVPLLEVQVVGKLRANISYLEIGKTYKIEWSNVSLMCFEGTTTRATIAEVLEILRSL